MAVIKKLSQDVASKIAAGEVVEKPFNVIKELMENSCDAEADRISVEISEGGLSRIKVIDNGKGVALEDLPLALERFATSKAETVDDVYAASTFGFRGEALAAISSISDFFMRSGQNGEAYEIRSQYGKITEPKPAPFIKGTSIEVLRIFENLPARRKFLKSTKSSEREIIKLIKHFSLVNPDKGISLMCDNKEVYHASLRDSLSVRASNVFSGKAFCIGNAKNDYVSVEAAATIPSASDRLKRDAIVIGVNGRLVKDPSLVQAVISAYYRLIPDGRYPEAVVNIKIDPSKVDSNVHPAKMEVRFENQQEIFSIVSEAVKNSFKGKGVNIDYYESNSIISSYSIDDSKNNKIGETNIHIFEQNELNISQSNNFNKNYADISSKPLNNEKQPYIEYNLQQNSTKLEYFFDIDRELNKQEYEFKESLKEKELSFEEKVAAGSFSVVGQIDKTYIVIETEDKYILFIDQHAAHEKVLFEKIQRDNDIKPKPSIILHEPFSIEVTDEIIESIDNYRVKLNRFGYDYKISGVNKIDILQVPYNAIRCDIGAVFYQIVCDLCISGKSKKEDAPRAMLSCKSAIKAGDVLNKEEMEYLVRLLFSTDNFGTCPHGRPIVYALGVSELARKFYR